MSRLRPPSGALPPAQAVVAGTDDPVDLRPLAEEVCMRYRAEFPDEDGRYGDAGMAWCVHDNQYILAWAAGALNGQVDLQHQLAWLAIVLESRDFPLDRLARDIDIAVDVTRERLDGPAAAIADELAVGAAFLRSRESFLAD